MVSWLLEVPGASRSVAEIVIPYHGQAFDRFLGYRPEQYCCGSTARALAVVAFWRLRQLLGSEAACVGVGCTASLVTDRPKRGAHRVHVAFQTENASACFHLQLTKDIRPRVAEDQLASRNRPSGYGRGLRPSPATGSSSASGGKARAAGCSLLCQNGPKCFLDSGPGHWHKASCR